MKRSRMTLAAIALSMMLGIGGRASAQDFTVNVPVNLSNMPVEITAVVVECAAVCVNIQFAFGNLGGSEVEQISDNPYVVGSGRQVRAINAGTGEFHETVTVSFSADSAHTPNNVGGFVCWMKLRDVQGIEEYPTGAGGIFSCTSTVSAGSEVFREAVACPPMITAGAFNNPAIAPDIQTEPEDCEVQ